jgi:hypothetical protein
LTDAIRRQDKIEWIHVRSRWSCRSAPTCSRSPIC